MVMVAELAQNATAAVRIDATASLKTTVENFVAFTFASRDEVGSYYHNSGSGSERLSKGDTVFFGVNLGGVQSGNLFQVVHCFEGAVLGAIGDDGGGLGASEGQSAFELDGRGFVHVHPGNFLGREVFDKVVEN